MERSGTSVRQGAASPDTAAAASLGAATAVKKRRPRKKKSGADGAVNGPETVDGGGNAAASAAAAPGPYLAGGQRVLAKQTSRERSPRRSTSPSAQASSPGKQVFNSAPAQFSVGQAVVIQDLVGKYELNGKVGAVVSYDSASGRYAVKLAGYDSVRVRSSNLRASIFTCAPDVG